MSTTNQSYIDALWEVQSAHPTLEHIPLIGKDEMILDVDLNSRTIKAPKFLSVQKDHQAETVYFRVDRYYEHQDLATKNCIIQYRTPDGKEYIYPVPSYDLRTYAVYDPYEHTDKASKILIPWVIQGAATATKGNLKFSIKFFKLSPNKELIYDLNTQVAQSAILEGQDYELNDVEPEQFTFSNEFLMNVNKIQELAQNGFSINWTEANETN